MFDAEPLLKLLAQSVTAMRLDSVGETSAEPVAEPLIVKECGSVESVKQSE